jgi:hypothetical protein
MVAVYTVLLARGADGVKVATEPPAVYVTVPATAVVPGPVSVNVDVVIVDAVIAWLNVAVTVVFKATPVAALSGVTAVTVGGTGAAAVVKVQV